MDVDVDVDILRVIDSKIRLDEWKCGCESICYYMEHANVAW